MRLMLAVLLVPFFASAQAKAPVIDTIILMKRPNADGYLMQYTEAGRNADGSPLVRTGDQVPLLTAADVKVVKPFFDFAAAKLKGKEELGTITVARSGRGKDVLQYTARVGPKGTEALVVSPLYEMTGEKERKGFESMFALANRARSGK